MKIDFHTHIFPDKIANRTIELLAEKGGITPFSDGTLKGLLCAMEKADVNISVNLPVVTNPSQFDSVNKFASEINIRFKNEKQRIISFAGIHPQCDEIDKKMAFIAKSGFLGIKIHPDYQQTYINDLGYEKILRCAKEYDLIVITHSGVDVGFKDQPIRCTPDRVLDLLSRVKHDKLVLAHMGANYMFDEVYNKLCEEDVYFDTAYILQIISEEKFKKILNRHGEDKILFASDSPWGDMENSLHTLRSFKLSKETENKIIFENAAKLLGI